MFIMGNYTSKVPPSRGSLHRDTCNYTDPNSLQKSAKHNRLSANARKLKQYLDEDKIEKFRQFLLRYELDMRKEIVTYEDRGISCLCYVCVRDNVEAIKFMMNNCEIDPNIEATGQKETLLHLACRKQSIAVAQYLIAFGANVHKLTIDGQSCLTLCGQNEMMSKMLIQNGANVNEWKDDRDRPKIFSACEEGRVNLLRFLLDHGADANIIGSEGLTPVEIASRIHYNSSQNTASNGTVQCLMKHGNLHEKYKVRVYDIIGCKLVRYYLLKSNDRTLRTSYILKAVKYWKNGMKIQLKLKSEDSSFHNKSEDSGPVKDQRENYDNYDWDEVLKDFTRVYEIAVTKIQHIFGISSVETISLIKYIAKWYVSSNQEAEPCIKFFQKMFMKTTDEVQLVSEKWLKEFMIILVYLVRIPKKFDVQIYDLTSGSTCWFINKLKETLESDTGKTLSPEIVATVFTILKHMISWKLTEEREVCLKKIISCLVFCNFSYESESFLHYAVQDYFCWHYHELEVRRSHCVQVLKSFLRHGMSVDVKDQSGNTPLTLLLDGCAENDIVTTELIKELLQYFHLDIKNKNGGSALQLLKQKGFMICEVKHRTLQCLCAEVIKMYVINFRHFVPASLVSFIDMH